MPSGGAALASDLVPVARLANGTYTDYSITFGSFPVYTPAGVAITGGTINGTAIGATTPSTGAFTALNVNAPYPSLTTALSITSAISASTGALPQVINAHVGSGGTLTTGGTQSYYGFSVDSDALAAPQNSTVDALGVGITVNTGAVGSRVAVSGALNINGKTGNVGNGIYVGGYFSAAANTNDNGTSTASSGNITALNPLSQLGTNCTYWSGISAAEFDINCLAGSSVSYKQGILIAQGGNSTVQGSLEDSAIAIANNTTGGTGVGWKTGLSFGSPQGWWAIDAAGTMIGTHTPLAGGPSYAAGTGIDFSAVTFSTAAFKSTGFLVDGSGNIKVGGSPVVAANTPGAALVNVTVGASPFTYTPTVAGTIVIAGGTVSATVFYRNGTSVSLGSVVTHFPMSAGDQMAITYSAAPTVTFIPR